LDTDPKNLNNFKKFTKPTKLCKNVKKLQSKNFVQNI